jgi:hypothetical protein
MALLLLKRNDMYLQADGLAVTDGSVNIVDDNVKLPRQTASFAQRTDQPTHCPKPFKYVL